MKYNYFYFFSIVFFLWVNKNIVAMELNCPVSQKDVKRLKQWNEDEVRRGSVVAYKAGDFFYYATLHSKETAKLYAILVGIKTNEQGVVSTQGKLVSADLLRIIAEPKPQNNPQNK